MGFGSMEFTIRNTSAVVGSSSVANICTRGKREGFGEQYVVGLKLNASQVFNDSITTILYHSYVSEKERERDIEEREGEREKERMRM